MHSAVDDHSRWAYSEVLSDERGATAAGFIGRAADAFAAAGINRIEEIITDNHLSYRNSAAVADTVARLGARHLFHQTPLSHSPLDKGASDSPPSSGASNKPSAIQNDVDPVSRYCRMGPRCA